MKIYGFCAVLLLLSACKTVQTNPENPALPQPVIAAEQDLGNRILKSIQDQNFKTFASLLAGRTGLKITEKDFSTSCKNLEQQFGALTAWHYELELKTPLVRNLVWVTEFKRKSKTGPDVTQEMLFRLVTGEADGKIQIMGFGFF